MVQDLAKLKIDTIILNLLFALVIALLGRCSENLSFIKIQTEVSNTLSVSILYKFNYNL